MLLPFHVLTPLVLAAFWLPQLQRGELPRLSPTVRRYGAALLALLALVTLSLLRSADVTMSAGRLTLLAANVIGVFGVLWALREHPQREALVQAGARAGLAFALVFNAATVGALLGLLPVRLELFPAAINLEPTLYGVIPRLSGPTLDMNRGAMLVLIFGTLIGMAPRGTRGRGLWLSIAAVLLVGSLSRSALLSTVPVLMVAAWQRWRVRQGNAAEPVVATTLVRNRMAGAAVLLGCAAGLALLLNPLHRERGARALEPLAERLDVREQSAQVHAHLFERGVEAGTRSLPQAMLGIGYGTSFRELADVFGGNPYGNYHSAWLALWVEIGFVAMLFAAATTIWPLRRRTRYAGLVLGLFVYNAVYIGFADQAFWLATGLAWLDVA